MYIYGGGLSQRGLPNPNPFLILIFELMSLSCLSHCWHSGAECYFWCAWIHTNCNSSKKSSHPLGAILSVDWTQRGRMNAVSAVFFFIHRFPLFPVGLHSCWSVFIPNISVFAWVCVSECVCLPTKVVAGRWVKRGHALTGQVAISADCLHSQLCGKHINPR